MQMLLKVGFLLCEHYSIDTQAIDLWYLLNPKVEPTVARDTVIEFIRDLIYIAVELPLKYIKVAGAPLKDQASLPTQGTILESRKGVSKEEKEETLMKIRAINYLREARHNRD